MFTLREIFRIASRWTTATKLFDVRLLRAKSAKPPMPNFLETNPPPQGACTAATPFFEDRSSSSDGRLSQGLPAPSRYSGRENNDSVKVRVYSAEKTIADCFKFRNKIGMDIVLEALRLYRARNEFSLQRLLEYARICRVEKVMSPYLEALA